MEVGFYPTDCAKDLPSFLLGRLDRDLAFMLTSKSVILGRLSPETANPQPERGPGGECNRRRRNHVVRHRFG